MCSLFAGLNVAAQQPFAKNPVAPEPVIIPCKAFWKKMMDEHGNSKRYDDLPDASGRSGPLS